MWYNPETYRWEGNDTVLSAFDRVSTASSTNTTSATLGSAGGSQFTPTLRGAGSGLGFLTDRDTASATPRPALITNIGASATKGVKVVGGMVFDPVNMCWLKVSHVRRGDSDDAGSDSDDPFKDIPDLEERTVASTATSDGIPGYMSGYGSGSGAGAGGGGSRYSDIKDDWLVGEEFDVGPEFVRRQREEEERWRRKCQVWVEQGRLVERGDAWKWAIREIVRQSAGGEE